MNASKIIVTVVIVLLLLFLIGTFFAKEGSIVMFIIRLIVGLSLITLFWSAIFGGIPWLLSEKCPKCKSLNSFSKYEEIIDGHAHSVYKKCRSCGYTKPFK